MVEPQTSRRRRFDLPAIAILAFVAAVAVSFLAWKWSEAASRKRCIIELRAKGVVDAGVSQIETWSAEWPFHNVASPAVFVLGDGTYSDDDVRRLRQTFPGVPIFHMDPSKVSSHVMGPEDLVNLPED